MFVLRNRSPPYLHRRSKLGMVPEFKWKIVFIEYEFDLGQEVIFNTL